MVADRRLIPVSYLIRTLDRNGRSCTGYRIRESRGRSPLRSFQAILNGTAAHVLSRVEQGAEYGQALFDAKRLGYAECDPSKDLDGRDAAHKLVLAAEALGYAGIWRTGDVAFERCFMDDLGLAKNEEIVGFLYLGTREGPPKPLPDLDIADYASDW